MAVGKLVKGHLSLIFAYCETSEHQEIQSLLDRQYSKATFGLSFPFCKDVEDIEPGESRRFWTDTYTVRGRRIRVTSQWTENHRARFVAYLVSRGIATEEQAKEREASAAPRKIAAVAGASSRANSRYRGNAIGNAQNAFVRNILSSVGTEAFSERDWKKTKEHFGNRCAYCGAEGDLVIEHAIPINKESLGEHRLGNLVPACRSCNASKANTDFRAFLGDNADAIERVEAYMDDHNYVPLEDSEQMRTILEMAYAEVAALADRYIAVINTSFGVEEAEPTKPSSERCPGSQTAAGGRCTQGPAR